MINKLIKSLMWKFTLHKFECCYMIIIIKYFLISIHFWSKDRGADAISIPCEDNEVQWSLWKGVFAEVSWISFFLTLVLYWINSELSYRKLYGGLSYAQKQLLFLLQQWNPHCCFFALPNLVPFSL